jgi:hypothetical protein
MARRAEREDIRYFTESAQGLHLYGILVSTDTCLSPHSFYIIKRMTAIDNALDPAGSAYCIRCVDA